ncbi:hypothetical protein ABIC60_000731 [Phyllobacterium ifriqiyense]
MVDDKATCNGGGGKAVADALPSAPEYSLKV